MKNTSRASGACPNMTLPFDESASVSDIMVNWPQTVPVFLKYQMLCIGCYVGPFHSIADACQEHGIDEQKLLRDLSVSLETAL